MNKKRDYLRLVLRREGARSSARAEAHATTRDEVPGDEELSALLASWRAPRAPSRTLDARLALAFREQTQARLPLWRRLFLTKIAVPVPAFAAAVLVLICAVSASVILRLRDVQTQSAPQAGVSTKLVAERVEVPIERVVERIVYVEREQQQRRVRRRNETRTSSQTAQTPQTVSHAAQSVGATATTVEGNEQRKRLEDSRATTMAGFKPAAEVKLRIIKGEQFER
ncbi:MAG TPA: hypothetical protein VGB73_19515 [Pyrinomonadaceae bacterium]|jgi:hypothetical protein